MGVCLDVRALADVNIFGVFCVLISYHRIAVFFFLFGLLVSSGFNFKEEMNNRRTSV